MTTRTPTVVFDHLQRMTDHRGTFEHALLSEPRCSSSTTHSPFPESAETG